MKMIAQTTLEIPVTELRANHINIWASIEEHFNNDPKLIRLAMGMLATQTYAALSRWNVLTTEFDENGKKTRIIDKERLFEMAGASRSGITTINNTVLWTQKFIKKYWPHAYFGQKLIRAVRQLLSNVFDLYEFIPGERGKTVKPPDLERFDFVKALQVYEGLEIKLLSLHTTEEGGINLDCIEEHGGALTIAAFNTLLGDAYREFRRLPVDTCIEERETDTEALVLPHPETVVIPPTKRFVLVWRSVFKLGERAWQTIFNQMTRKELSFEWLCLPEEGEICPDF